MLRLVCDTAAFRARWPNSLLVFPSRPFALHCLPASATFRAVAANSSPLMDASQLPLAALAILALVALAFFAVFRGRGKVQLKGPFGTSVKAEGENPAPPANIPSGVKIKNADAGKNLVAHSSASGGVDLEKIRAKGNLAATHTPGAAPPKS